MMPENEEARDFCWNALGALALHPVRVEIIEALRWIGLSLSATDLVRMFEGKHVGLRVEYHLRRLAKLGVLEEEEADDDRKRAPMGQRFYRLVEQS